LNSTRSAIDWPANSPDLNPIENLWQIIKDKFERRMPQIIEQLKQFLTEEWEAIPNKTVINLVQSIKNRCELVIEANGDRIPY